MTFCLVVSGGSTWVPKNLGSASSCWVTLGRLLSSEHHNYHVVTTTAHVSFETWPCPGLLKHLNGAQRCSPIGGGQGSWGPLQAGHTGATGS